tara:strand:+ start:1003 stop:1665 length:663 start_codon:yes stop_codon:yes gene_type:complete
MKIFRFNKNLYPFDKLVASLYDYNLDKLNDDLDHTKGTLGKDTNTIWHKIFYDKLRSGWPELVKLYKSFIKSEIGPLFIEEEKLIYQKTPGFRVNQPGGKAVYIPHSDGDKNHLHPVSEINVYMPLTKSFGNNSIWIESIPGLGDFTPAKLEFGECLMFYGNQLRHLNHFNNTGVTRCSFDFRVIPPVNYDDSYQLESATMSNKFLVGEYYEIIDINKSK